MVNGVGSLQCVVSVAQSKAASYQQIMSLVSASLASDVLTSPSP